MKEIISFEDFKKIEMRTARILRAERVEKSEKLVKLTVDAGDEVERQIVAGVGMTYSPEDLKGKTIVIVANLASRKLMGVESHGMLLTASNGDEKFVLLTVSDEVASGSEIR